MKQWLIIISSWIVSLFASWKLGEHNERQNNKIKEAKRKADILCRSYRAGNDAVAKWLQNHK